MKFTGTYTTTLVMSHFIDFAEGFSSFNLSSFNLEDKFKLNSDFSFPQRFGADRYVCAKWSIRSEVDCCSWSSCFTYCFVTWFNVPDAACHLCHVKRWIAFRVSYLEKECMSVESIFAFQSKVQMKGVPYPPRYICNDSISWSFVLFVSDLCQKFILKRTHLSWRRLSLVFYLL